ncbi:thermonuclease family protein [Priestia aryabhattai]|uniref:thermonuclease family protein n=1 Tax=Priestia aryabhattai TaxID=412384 RepID=UPI0039A30549
MEIQDNYIRHIYEIVDVHDGDTIKAIVELGYNQLGRIKFRFKAINTAEVGKEKKQSELRVKLANDAKAYVQEKIMNHEVRVYSEKFKEAGFSRYEGTIYYLDNGEWINLNEELLAIGLAQKYYLGASKDFGEFK